MAKALKIAGMIVVGAALVVATAGAGAALIAGLSVSAVVGSATIAGVGLGTLLAVGAGLSAAGSLLSPKPKAPNVSSATTDRLSASIVLRAPRTFVFGRTAMATDIRDEELSTDQAYLHRFMVVASHKVQSIEEIWFDDKQAWTSASGVTAAFSGYLTVTTVLQGSAANAINIGARMGVNRRYTGCAYVYLKFRLTGTSSKATSPFSSAVPTRTTVIGKGSFVYDPRLDTTAGGSGAQRAADQTTWAWDDSAARNPALQLLTYLLGWRIQNPSTSAYKLAVGKGIPAARLDLASFITAANFCDESVAKAAGGTEPRYRSDGIFSEADDLSTVLDNFKAAMNATLDDVDGKIRVTVLHNDLASPIGSLSTGDVLGDFTWTQTPPLSDSFSIVRGGYTDPSTTSLYQLVDYPEVSISSPDGIERASTVNLPLVQSASQAQRLAKMRLQRVLYGGTFTATFQSTAWKFQKGDCIQLTFTPLGWSNKLFRIAEMTVQIDGTVPMVLREENAAIYAWDASDAAAVTGVASTTYDPSLVPVVQAIADNAAVAAAAQTAANAAATNATASLAEIAVIQSDGYLSAGEKPDIIRQVADIVNEVTGIQAQASALGVAGSVYDAIGTYYNALIYGYLPGLSPAWNDTARDTAIVPATFNTRFSDYYAARAALLNAIAAKAATLSTWDGLSGAKKPADNATRNDAAANLLAAPVTLDRCEVAGGAAVENTGSGSANRDRYRINFANSSGSAYPERDWNLLPVTPGETLYFSYSAAFINSSNGSIAVATQLFDSTGAFTGPGPTFANTLAASGGAGSWRPGGVASIVVPAGAAKMRPAVQATGTIGNVLAADFYFGRQQPGADVTAANQANVVGPASIRVPANATGSALADTTAAYKLFIGPTDVTSSAAWSVTSSAGCTVAVDAGGVVTRTGALTTSSVFTLRASYAGATVDTKVAYVRDDAAASSGSTGAGGGTSGSGDVSSTSGTNAYSSAGGESEFTCVAGSGGQVALSIELDYSITAATHGTVSESGYAKLQWAPIGGTFADVATETASSGPATYSYYNDPNDATIVVSTTKTGLTAGTTYRFRCLWRRGGSGGTVSASAFGTLTGAGS